MAHHPLSMSSWPKLEQCPCAQPSDGSQPESEEAKSGTRSHSWLSYLIERSNGTDVEEPLGVSPDEKSRAEWAYEKISAIAGSYAVRSEVRVEVSGHGELHGIHGTADAIISMPERLIVIDYKTYSTNPCDLTAQPEGYALAAYSSEPFAPREVEVVILHGGSREVERKLTSIGEIEERAHRIIGGHLKDADNLERACPNHFCQYCGRLRTCPATDRTLTKVNTPSAFESMSLAEQMVVVKQAKTICDRVERQIKAELDEQIRDGIGVSEAVVAGGGVAWHYRLKPGNEKLADICGLASEVAGHGVSNESLMSICSVSKTAICAALTEANPSMTQAEARRVIKPFYKSGTPSKFLERLT